MTDEPGLITKDINEHEHASRPGWITLLVLIGLAAAIIIWSVGGFG